MIRCSNGHWIWWPEQCLYCQNRFSCSYKNAVNSYISALRDIDDNGIYGSLSWWCDYYVFDETPYLKDTIGDCCNE